MKQKKGITVYDMVVVGLLAAMVFVCTAFLKIGPIPTPAGPTQIKTGNIICLLAGLLFGGWRGGLAAGIGSAVYDLTDPAFAASAPYTLVFFFAMGAVCGAIAHGGGAQGDRPGRNLAAAVAGAASYLVLHLGKSILVLILAGSTPAAAVAACGVKFITSGINAAAAVAASCLLAPLLRPALERAGVFHTLRTGRPYPLAAAVAALPWEGRF